MDQKYNEKEILEVRTGKIKRKGESNCVAASFTVSKQNR